MLSTGSLVSVRRTLIAKGFAAFLKEQKIVHTFRESAGAHTWINWRSYLNETAPLLFQQ